MQLIILAAVFACATLLVAGFASMLTSKASTEVEDRLSILTGVSHAGGGGARDDGVPALLNASLEDSRTFADGFLEQFFDVRRFLAQADLKVTPLQFLLLIIAFGAAGFAIVWASPFPIILAPIAAVITGSLPLVYTAFLRTRRMRAFAKQLPDALELIGRALRAGHSLAAGFSLVGEEMSDPIRLEFARCYEEQNLGIPLEEALKGMTERVPNLDLKFFATAVILQRQTGGDLAEILDKIGYVIRERFKIFGQIQALTGEGRLSGIVLLSLPPVLFVVMYRLNADYVMKLFEDPIGHWLLGGAVILQILGAIVIKKIVTIRV
jgi:tight adherence protein B